METYETSDYIRNNLDNLDPMPGLAEIMRGARDSGIVTTIDFGEGDEMLVTPETARYAAHEVEEAFFNFYKDGKRVGTIFVIPHNGGPDEWLVDYSVRLEDYVTFPF